MRIIFLILHSLNQIMVIMKQLFIVTVEKRSHELGKHTKLFERQVEIDSSLSLPYDSIIQSLRFLFGVESIIVFRSELYGKD